MAKNDVKKTEHASERHEIAEDIIAIRNLKSVAQEKNDELIQDLLDKKELTQTSGENACPFPQHEAYAKIWKKFKDYPIMQKYMKENIRISADGKIEVIKMKKKFSILTAEHDGKDIFTGEHEDQHGRKGMKGVTYLTGRAAERACKEQNKGLLNDGAEVEQFINYFPGVTTKEKIFNFVSLFGLEKAGYLLPSKGWLSVGSIGYAKLSRVDENDSVCAVEWNDDAFMDRSNQIYPSPFVACEDCSA